MNKYTFIFEFKKGTYIKQILSEDVQSATIEWGSLINKDEIEIPNISDEELDLLRSYLSDDDYKVVNILNVTNVWCITFSIKKHFALLNVILTV